MKSKLTLISAAAAVVQLASCNGNPLEDIDYNDPVLHALTETESGTKTVLGKEDNAGNVPIMWSSGDEIIVTGDSREKACSYYKTADKNTSAAEFRYDRSKNGNRRTLKKDKWYAFYPSSSYSFSGEEHIMELPQKQTYSPDNIGEGAMPMYAVSDDDNLSFRNLCGILRIRLNSLKNRLSISRIKIASDKDLSGKIIRYSAQDGIGYLTSEGSSKASAWLECPKNVVLFSDPADFYIVMPPGSHSKFKIQLCGSNGVNFIYATPKPIIIERSGITTLDLDLSKFICTGTDDIIAGKDNSALTGLEYSFTGGDEDIFLFKDGEKGNIDLTSMISENYENGDSVTKGVAWHSEFSTDGGKTWSRTLPDMFSSFTLSGNGDKEHDIISYEVTQSPDDRECKVRLVQEMSGKNKEFSVRQLSSAIIVEVETKSANELLTIFHRHGNNIETAYYDDGTSTSFKPSTYEEGITHKYKDIGIHRVILKVRKGIPALENLFLKDFYVKSPYRIHSVDISHVDFTEITSLKKLFDNCVKVSKIILPAPGTKTPVLKNISGLFFNCQSLKTADLRWIDSKVLEDISDLFKYCYSLESVDLSSIFTDHVTNMANTFYYCRSLKELDVRHFKTSNVTDFTGMFSLCTGLTALDVTGFDTSNATSMTTMFRNCSALKTLDVSGFNTSKNTSFGDTFSGCESLEELDVSGFDTRSAKYFNGTFQGCRKLKKLDVSGFDMSEAVNTSDMFNYCSSVTELDVSGFRTSSLEDMSYMFSSINVPHLDLSNFDFSCATNMRGMFYCCKTDSLVLSGIHAPNLTNAYMLFFQTNTKSITIKDLKCHEGCSFSNMFNQSTAEKITLTNFNGANGSDMSYMFNSCRHLKRLILDNFSTDNVQNMNHMFTACYILEDLDLSMFKTSNVTNFNCMFQGCRALTSMDLSSFDTSNGKEFYSMFEDCTGVSELDVSNFRFTSATDMSNLFAKNYNLRSIRMDMRGIPENCTLTKVVYGVMTVGTMFCKDNVQDSRITESLPKDWTISSF